MEPQLTERLGWTLVHFLWEAAIVAGTYALLATALKRKPANLRYAIGCLALLFFIALPIATFLLVTTVRTEEPVVISAEWKPELQGFHFTLDSSNPRLISKTEEFAEHLAIRLDGWMPVVMRLWLLGTCVFACYQVGGWLYLLRVIRRDSGDMLDDQRQELVSKMKIKRSVAFRVSDFIDVPATVGWLKPVVLLPASMVTGFSSDQIEAVLLHELAHIRRHDYLVNCFQVAIETIFFFHPAVWWVSSQVRKERENCCDDIAAQVIQNPVRYARILLLFEELRINSTPLAVSFTGGSLSERIWRLIQPERLVSPKRFSASSAILATALLCLTIAGDRVFASQEDGGHPAVAVEPLNRGVYRICGVNTPRRNFIPTLAAAVADMRQGNTLKSLSLDDLVQDLLESDPCSLEQLTVGRTKTVDPFAFEREPTWILGRYQERMQIVEELSRRAMTSVDFARKRKYSIAALLLCSQDSAEYSAGVMQTMLNSKEFVFATGLESDQVRSLRNLIDNHLTITRLAAQEISRFDEAFTIAKKSDAGSAEAFKTEVTCVRRLSELGCNRYDITWQTAHCMSQLVEQRPKDPTVNELWTELSSSNNNNVLSQFMRKDEAFHQAPASQSHAIQRVSGKELDDLLKSSGRSD